MTGRFCHVLLFSTLFSGREPSFSSPFVQYPVQYRQNSVPPCPVQTSAIAMLTPCWVQHQPPAGRWSVHWRPSADTPLQQLTVSAPYGDGSAAAGQSHAARPTPLHASHPHPHPVPCQRSQPPAQPGVAWPGSARLDSARLARPEPAARFGEGPIA